MDLPLAIDLARFQFAFTVSFHIVFPAFSIGLASYLAVLEGLWLATGRQVYIDTFRYWLKIFAVAFGMGVVSGIVMSYQFGTNWSVFSDKTGPVLGPLMGYEVLSAMTSARPSRRRRSSRRRAAPGARWSAPSVQHPATHHGEPRTDARSDPA
jgi:hypothetical protein